MIKDLTVVVDNCLEALKSIPDGSVQCCITSPPYWGLRDYGEGTSVKWPNGWAGQHGLEPTSEMYVDHEVMIFREVRRVLADDGTLWLNLGDSYAVASGNGNQGKNGQRANRRHTAKGQPRGGPGLKPKDLVGIPWRVAFALQSDGWYLRQDIIWNKPNPMPESVKDRCTKAHEYLFLLSKSPRYFYNADAIKEPCKYRSETKMPDGWDTGSGGHGSYHRSGREKGKKSGNIARKYDHLPGKDGVAHSVPWEGSNRNKRSVWTISTSPFKEAHFATFPPSLIKPCVLAGSKPGDTILDPFGGTGTTAGVALDSGRKAIIIEVSQKYSELIPDRISSITDAVRQGRLFYPE